jgi:hypothetical protein
VVPLSSTFSHTFIEKCLSPLLVEYGFSVVAEGGGGGGGGGGGRDDRRCSPLRPLVDDAGRARDGGAEVAALDDDETISSGGDDRDERLE